MTRLHPILAGLLCLAASLVSPPGAQAQTTTVEYLHTDALGTPVAVTDATGAVIERSEYEPYGQLVNRPLTDGPGFTGHVQDAATGLTYMQQRYYDPMVGRFLSVDAVTAYENNVGAFNRYWYASNNPYKFIDPDGRTILRIGNLAKIEADIQILRSKPVGAALVDRLENDTNIHTVMYGVMPAGIPAATESSDLRSAMPKPDGKPGQGSGSFVSIDLNQPIYEMGPNGVVEVPGFVRLGHEFGHSDAMRQGIQPEPDYKNIIFGTTPNSETHSLQIENGIRSEHGLPERPAYYQEPVEPPPPPPPDQ